MLMVKGLMVESEELEETGERRKTKGNKSKDKVDSEHKVYRVVDNRGYISNPSFFKTKTNEITTRLPEINTEEEDKNLVEIRGSEKSQWTSPLVSPVVMRESEKNDGLSSFVYLKFENETLEDMDSSLTFEFMPQRLVMERIPEDFIHLIFENLSQEGVIFAGFIDASLTGGHDLHDISISHSIVSKNSSTELNLIGVSFLASSNLLTNSSLKGSSSTGCQSILSQNSQSSSVISPVCLYLANMSRFINLITALAKNSESSNNSESTLNSSFMTDSLISITNNNIDFEYINIVIYPQQRAQSTQSFRTVSILADFPDASAQFSVCSAVKFKEGEKNPDTLSQVMPEILEVINGGFITVDDLSDLNPINSSSSSRFINRTTDLANNNVGNGYINSFSVLLLLADLLVEPSTINQCGWG